MTALPSRHVYLDGTDLERDCEALMRFRLIYDGDLRPTQHDPNAKMVAKRAPQQHRMRQAFHGQLKELWQADPFLRTATLNPGNPNENRLIIQDVGTWPDTAPRDQMAEVLANLYRRGDYRYVPLVRKEYFLQCSLRILFLRRDTHLTAGDRGDTDNRVKSAIDALSMPANSSQVPFPPDKENGEDPFFVLLDDDKRITHLEVETDRLLLPREVWENDESSRARLIISVEIRPYYTTTFNVSFA